MGGRGGATGRGAGGRGMGAHARVAQARARLVLLTVLCPTRMHCRALSPVAQALYSAVVAANHVELMTPYYDFIAQAVADGGPALESAALGCPAGVHFSVDLAPFGLKVRVEEGSVRVG